MTYNNKHIKGWIRVIILLVAFIFFGNFFKLIGAIVADVDVYSPIHESPIHKLLIFTFIECIGVVLIILLILKIIDSESFLDLGLRIKNKLFNIFIGILVGFTIMSLATFFLMLVGEITFKELNFNLKKILCLFLLFSIVAFKEEVLYRGYILRNLLYSFNKYFALLISAILFSLMHGMNPDIGYIELVNLFLAGVLLGISYTYDKNLWFPIALHFSWNFFQSLLGLNASENDPYSLIKFDTTANSFINISNYTFDISFLYTFMNIILIICVFIWYRYKAKKKELLEQ